MKKVIPEGSTLVPENARLVFEGEIFSVWQWQQTLYDGSQATFEALKRPDTTNVICIDGEKIIIIDDEQPNRANLKTFPGGRVDPEDADIVAAAQREVLEEIGYRFKNWRLVEVKQPIRKIEWFTYLLLAWDAESKQPPHHDAGEKISAQEVSFDELKQLVMNREGYLAETADIFEPLHSLEDLMLLPEFHGQNVDR